MMGMPSGSAIPTNDRQARFNDFTTAIIDCLERGKIPQRMEAYEVRASKSQPGHFEFTCSGERTYRVSYTDLDDILLAWDSGGTGQYVGADPNIPDRMKIIKNYLVNGVTYPISFYLYPGVLLGDSGGPGGSTCYIVEGFNPGNFIVFC